MPHAVARDNKVHTSMRGPECKSTFSCVPPGCCAVSARPLAFAGARCHANTGALFPLCAFRPSLATSQKPPEAARPSLQPHLALSPSSPRPPPIASPFSASSCFCYAGATSLAYWRPSQRGSRLSGMPGQPVGKATQSRILVSHAKLDRVQDMSAGARGARGARACSLLVTKRLAQHCVLLTVPGTSCTHHQTGNPVHVTSSSTSCTSSKLETIRGETGWKTRPFPLSA